jgi:hypothetical protein
VLREQSFGVLDMIYLNAIALPLSSPRQSEFPNASMNRLSIEGGQSNILDWHTAPGRRGVATGLNPNQAGQKACR